MTNVSRGKQFEDCVSKGFKKVKNFTLDRLPDPMAGFAGVRNICDFFGYLYPHAYYVECKSCYGNTLNFSNITSNQWSGLIEKVKNPGVIAGYMIWFIDHDKTIFVSADELNRYAKSGARSVNVTKLDEIDHIVINGKKKQVLFDYDFESFIKVSHIDAERRRDG